MDRISEEGSSAFEEPEPAESISGLLVSRDHSVRTPASDHLPGLSALLRVSRDVGAVLLGGAPSRDGVDTSWDAAARQSVADQLRTAASRVQLPAVVVERLRQASRLLGVEIVSESMCLELDDIGSVLTPGVRICFTGTAQDSTGQIVERWAMEQLAEAAGLTPVQSVTKARCEVLVTAEAGTQSGKARKAQEYGKPVFTADEFLEWAAKVSSGR